MRCVQNTITSLLLAVLGMGSLLLGCDQVSRPDPAQPPSLSGLTVTPDSVDAADLPPEQITDTLAVVDMEISARAADPDGTIDRVVFTFEPSSNPRFTVSDTLLPVEGTANQYRFDDFLPIFQPAVDEVYTIRVFAVDDDSLASNQGVGRFRFVPES
jgi:hypothetical protein